MPSADGGLGDALVGEKIAINTTQILVNKLLGEGMMVSMLMQLLHLGRFVSLFLLSGFHPIRRWVCICIFGKGTLRPKQYYNTRGREIGKSERIVQETFGIQ
jgi:hypothetical protein